MSKLVLATLLVLTALPAFAPVASATCPPYPCYDVHVYSGPAGADAYVIWFNPVLCPGYETFTIGRVASGFYSACGAGVFV